VPFLALDTLQWEPDWVESTPESFLAKLRVFLDENADRGWVIDGNYSKKIGNLTDECTDIIWLDPPLLLYFPRLVVRTFLRLLRLRPGCSPGCEERFSEAFFSKESIMWWCLSQHWKVRNTYRARMRERGITTATGTIIPEPKIRRIGGWGGELTSWLEDVNRMILE